MCIVQPLIVPSTNLDAAVPSGNLTIDSDERENFLFSCSNYKRKWQRRRPLVPLAGAFRGVPFQAPESRRRGGGAGPGCAITDQRSWDLGRFEMYDVH